MTRLAVGVVLVAVAGGCGSPAGHPEEASAVGEIERLGGKVEYDGDGPQRRVTKIYLHDTPVTDAELALVERLPKLKNVFLGRTRIGDEGLKHLKHASELETLGLNRTAVTDAGLRELSGLKQLKTINVQETKVSAAAADKLRQEIPGVRIAR